MTQKDKTREKLTEEIKSLKKREAELGILAIERTLAEQALLKSEKKYRSLFDNLIISTTIATLDGKTLMASHGFEELTGYSKEEFIAFKDISEMYVERAQQKQLMALLRKDGKVRDFEVALKRKDGTVYEALMNLDFMELAREQVVLTSMLDITERKKAEEALREAYTRLKEMQDQLIQAEKLTAIGQLASGVAHEVRNPLGIILQGVNYLERRLSSQEEDILDTLKTLKDGIHRANNIVNSMLDFSKDTNLALTAEDIGPILESSLTLVKTRLKFEHIDMTIEIKKDIPKVLADKNKLEQVFINLLLNAAQAMPDGGKLVIRIFDKKLEEIRNGVGRRVQDYFRLGEKVLLVEIEDTGIGIPEESLKRIFDPFFTTKGQKGVGLGLSVTRNIINMHRGVIFAESKLGQGTKMTFILKVAEQRA